LLAGCVGGDDRRGAVGAADAYQQLRATGSFILIDEVSHQTVAAGMIRLD